MNTEEKEERRGTDNPSARNEKESAPTLRKVSQGAVLVNGAPLDRVLKQLDYAKSGNGYSARCPAHPDKKPSLSITDTADGTVLLKCHAGCDTQAVVKKMGLTLRDLFPRTERFSGFLAAYDYTDEQGTLLYQVVRFKPKKFSQRRPDGQGGWIWDLKGVRRVLYRLPEVLTADTVYVVEGEKDVETLRAWGLVATCNSGGAEKWRDEYAEVLRGKHVIILSDNDEPGEKHALQVARSVFPVAASVQLLPVFDVKDVSEWKAAGHTKEEFLALVKATPVWTETEQTAKAAANTAWPEPGALPEGLLPVPALAAEMIPEPLRPWLTDIAERMQCPLDFPAVGALITLATVVGRRLGIRPKQYDDWLVTPNLWGGVVGRPGLMKTPALTEAMRPLNRLVMDAQAEYEAALVKAPAAEMRAEAKREALKRRLAEELRTHAKWEKEQRKKPEPTEEPTLMTEEEIAAELDACLKAAQPPVQRRYLVNDSTVEKLGELLNQNPNGLLLFRDELTGWLRMLDREGHQNDRPFYNEAWNGDKSYTYDRIARGTLHIKAACLSLLGGIQPGPLAVYLHGAMQGGADDDGLVQRLQLLVYPDDPGEWKNVDRWPDTPAKNRAYTIFQALAALDPATLGAHVEEGEPMPFLRFAPAAQEVFNEWWADLEGALRTPDEHPAIESHLSKYRSLMPSLALLIHLITCVDQGTAGPVSLPATRQAAAWCDYLEAHARRVYQTVSQPAVLMVRRLAAKITESALPSPFTVREVVRKAWSGLTTLDEIREAVESLEDLNWLRSERSETGTQGGRPRLAYRINPAFPPKPEEQKKAKN